MTNLFFSIITSAIMLVGMHSKTPDNPPTNNKEGGGCYLQLIGVKCISQEDFTGTDQIYINVDGQKYTNTARISSGQYMDLTNLDPIYMNSGVTITIWEEDWDPDDLLLKKHIDCSFKGAGQKTANGTSDANYKLYYKVY